MKFLSRLRAGFSLLKPSEFALTIARCPFCGPTLFVRLRDEPIGVRCVRCGASAVHLSLGWALRRRMARLEDIDACELSARGPLVAYLRRSARSLATSEYFPGIASGSTQEGVRCEDVQNLSYADASFDLVTHTEVLEHVPDDARAFAELFRVLRPGGTMLFTVPLHGGSDTVVRAHLRDGEVEHLREPVYHNDPLRAQGILAFRDYGTDILDRLREAGFVDADIDDVAGRVPWIAGHSVVAARKR
ncbi:MAG: methyltransferase domain-containing protein [Rhodanobacteraceae bacterium]